jgi:hypothetical protein
MKLHEIREYDPEPVNNTPGKFMESILTDLEDILPFNWDQNRNEITFDLENSEPEDNFFGRGEKVEFLLLETEAKV